MSFASELSIQTLAQLALPRNYRAMTTATTQGDTRLPELLSLRELAEYLGVPPSSVYYWRTQGKGPPGFQIGKQLRFRAADVDAWVQEQAARAGA